MCLLFIYQITNLSDRSFTLSFSSSHRLRANEVGQVKLKGRLLPFFFYKNISTTKYWLINDGTNHKCRFEIVKLKNSDGDVCYCGHPLSQVVSTDLLVMVIVRECGRVTLSTTAEREFGCSEARRCSDGDSGSVVTPVT